MLISPSQIGEDVGSRYVLRVADLTNKAAARYELSDRPVRWFSWKFFRPRNRKLPTQGWKIHVSCSAVEAPEMLDAVTPIILARDTHASFKLPSTLQGVLALNANLAGNTQAGKILTIYPEHDAQTAALMDLLSAVWTTREGPAVVSDIAVTRGRGVYVRYGLFFADRPSFDALGRPKLEIRDAQGNSLPDMRSTDGTQPPFASPLPARHLCHPVSERVGSDRYLPVAQVGNGMRTETTVALDVRAIELLVIKRARRGLLGDISGHDAISRLRNEQRMLAHLHRAGLSAARVVDFLETDEQGELVKTYLDGIPLAAVIKAHPVGGLLGLCDAILRLHSAHVAHRDVKLSNALLVGDQVQLIDLELASAFGRRPITGGTPGYIPPEGADAVAAPSVDAYALGATIFEAVTGVSPAQLPVTHTRGRMLALLPSVAPAPVSRLVQELTHENVSRRATIEHARNVLDGISSQEPTEIIRARKETARTFRQFAIKSSVLGGVAARGYWQEQEKGACWANRHLHAGHLCYGINIGAAGVVLGLLTIDMTLSAERFTSEIIDGARWLAALPTSDKAHGLFTGNAGVALTLGVVARRFPGADSTVHPDAALERLVLTRKQSDDCDLFSGAAGIVWAACILSRVLDDPRPLDLAAKQVKQLHSKVRIQDGTPVWPSSPHFNPLRESYFGAAHGSSGIAMALLAWGSATGCGRSTELALEAFDGLANLIHQGSGGGQLPEGPGRRSRSPLHWCHGTAGLLWCMLQSGDQLAELMPSLREANEAVLRARPLLGNPTYCHGMAGVLELFRMLDHQPALADIHVASRRELARRSLRAFHQRGREGVLWSSENPMDITPDLWVGFLGPAASLAMDAADCPFPLLSEAWLLKCSGGLSTAADHGLAGEVGGKRGRG